MLELSTFTSSVIHLSSFLGVPFLLVFPFLPPSSLSLLAYKLPTLYVAILSLLGFLVLLLLVCLFSCLTNVRRRAEKARQIALIAQQADKGDGDAFVKVTHPNTSSTGVKTLRHHDPTPVL